MTVEEALEKGMLPVGPVLHALRNSDEVYKRFPRIMWRLWHEVEYVSFDVADRLLCKAWIHPTDDEELGELYARVVLPERPFRGDAAPEVLPLPGAGMLQHLYAQAAYAEGATALLLRTLSAPSQEAGDDRVAPAALAQGEVRVLPRTPEGARPRGQEEGHLPEMQAGEREAELPAESREEARGGESVLPEEQTEDLGAEEAESRRESGRKRFGCGHDKSPDNTYTPPKGSSRCMTCRKANTKVQNGKRRQRASEKRAA